LDFEFDPSSHPQAIRDVLAEELIMTMSALKARPKVYWIWNHRRWCLENTPDGPGEAVHGWKQDAWNKELFVVQKMLDADPRNCMFFLPSLLRLQSPLYPFPEFKHMLVYSSCMGLSPIYPIRNAHSPF